MSVLSAGQMNREITIQQNVASQDGPEPVEDWQPWLEEIAAERMDRTGSEVFRAGREELESPAIFRFRWCEGLTGDMQIVDDPNGTAEVYDIENITELGLREAYEVLAVKRGG